MMHVKVLEVLQELSMNSTTEFVSGHTEVMQINKEHFIRRLAVILDESESTIRRHLQ
jgi:hypothetical protein